MTTHIAVIGAGFGDEGKGQVVDYIASKHTHDIVVRYNGGSQCGHTVVTPDNKKHIFSQIGAGAIVGLPTHLSRFMYVNPLYLMRELTVFSNTFGFIPKITISDKTNFIIPYDVHSNQTIETQRGVLRHGSTGHGLFNAVKRSIWPDRCVTAKFAFTYSKKELLEKLTYSNVLVDNISYINSIETLQELGVTLSCDDDIVNKHSCIFEGGQGLLLDRNSGFFPHVTPSNTGLTNILSLLSFSNKRSSITPVYVTRTFLTRHGAGPLYFPKYDSPANYEINSGDLVDDTNVYNEWQGLMRYGVLHVPQLKEAVYNDVYTASQINSCILTTPKLAITWGNKFPNILEQLNSNFNVFSISTGKTRNTFIASS